MEQRIETKEYSGITCSYSPEDDKLRLSASSRLDKETYARVKEAGYGWAPRQECFYAVWSPKREDLALELAGEIGDEDTTLAERAEERAERFDGYRENRLSDAHAAKAGVDRIADGIPFGQPILIGHHSQRRAEKDAEKIENGMRKAVKMWETAGYWKSRAAGAIAHAKYKELPAVRARRIKGIEADLRKQEKYISESEMWLKAWIACGADEDKDRQARLGLRIAGSCNLQMPRKEGDRPDWNQSPSAYDRLSGSYPTLYASGTVAECVEAAQVAYPRSIARHERWAEHFRNRLEYEKVMLADGGGLAADKFDFAVGGRVSGGRDWYVVTGLNRKGGVLLSLSVMGRFCSTLAIEDVKDYREPEEGDAEKVKAVKKLAPLCNFKGDGFRECTKAELKSRYSFIRHFPATETHGAYRAYCRLKGGPGLDCHNDVQVFQTDVKVKEAPTAAATPAAPVVFDRPAPAERPMYVRPEPNEFDAIKTALRSGVAVQVVSAPQLFPTPRDLARRMVSLSGIMGGERVLEPSAGTGVIVREIHNGFTGADNGRVVAVEVNGSLVRGLEQTRGLTVGANSDNYEIVHGDFLEQNGNLGKFDVVLMNPPFIQGADIKHIQHAVKFLKPGGRLVAICANGPRQQDVLMGMADHWEELPAGTFAEQGTQVNTALMVYTAP